MSEIIKLPKPKKQTDKTFEIVHRYNKECSHLRYEVDEALSEVTCRDCGAKLTPMFVLLQLAKLENSWISDYKRTVKAVEQLSKRQRTKCDHCGKMTRISRR